MHNDTDTDTVARPPEHAPINWVTTILFTALPLAAVTVVPWYGFTHGFSLAAWVLALVFLWACGIAITAGYHRLWAHRAYSAHWLVRTFLMLFGAMAAAAASKPFARTAWPPAKSLLAAAFGGLLMGWGARLGFGCNIGAFVGGVASGSLHGWVWFAAALAGCTIGIRLRPRFGLSRE